ncbi:MAG: ABC transporter permease [Allobranchiibius sp.]
MNAAIVRLGIRSLTVGSRLALLVAFPALLLLLGVLLRTVGGADFGADQAAAVLKVFGLTIVVPIVTLIATSTLISSELDDSSIIYLLSKPVPRLTIVASKAAVILATVVLCAAVPIGLTGLILVGSAERVAFAAFTGALVSAVAYAGIFIVLATMLKRSVIGALVYWLVWETTLVSLIGPIRWLSARAWGSSVLDQILTPAIDNNGVPWWYAVLGMSLALVIGVALAGRRLFTMTLSDD